MIGVGFLFAESIAEAAAAHPEVNYGIVDSVVDAPNVRGMVFAEEEGSFLVGAAAALQSATGQIGFIGGVEIDLIKKFEAGYRAGAEFINPDILVDVKYISQPPDFSGFGDPAKGQEIALGMYSSGADVVYQAAGGSGGGVFAAAKSVSEETGTKVWAIGVDSDQALTAPEFADWILTSMLKRVDVAVYQTIKDQVDGNFSAGVSVFGLAADGVGYSTTGGHVDAYQAQLDGLKAQIISGAITVPTVPGEAPIIAEPRRLTYAVPLFQGEDLGCPNCSLGAGLLMLPVFESLLKSDLATGAIVPGEGNLAETWSVNGDFTEYTFKLREGMQFHQAGERSPPTTWLSAGSS